VFGTVADIMDHAAKTGAYLGVLGRLRSCAAPQCDRFAYDPFRRRKTCSNGCRRAVTAGPALHRQRARRARVRDDERTAGLDAAAHRCRDPRLLSSAGRGERFAILVARGIEETKAHSILDREVGRMET
jgi:hypothetical protein